MILDDPSVIKPALTHLKSSFNSGKTLPIQYRKQQLQNLLRGIKELEPKLHEAVRKDLGLNEITSKFISISFTVSGVVECLQEIDKWTKPEYTDLPLLVGPGKSYIKSEPLGVALILGAWNYPLVLSIPYLATAIAAGDCCIVKPSELSPHTSHMINELITNYLDQDCYRCIEGKVEVAKAIIHERFDVIVFTGSTEKGKLVAKAASENLIPYILELGGKSPTIVDKEADLDNAALRIMQARYVNAGQTCIACDYVFAHKDIKEKLLEKFKEKLNEFYGPDPSKSEDYTKVVNEFHVQRLKGYLEEDHGGKVIVGGQSNIQDRYFAPTIVDNPKYTSKMMQEEIFGPILPVYEFDDFDFVLNFIKERPKPLALYYYGSGSSINYKRLSEETSSGALVLNESLFHAAINGAPFGGVGMSGQGKLHGYHGFKSLSHQKQVLEKGTLNGFPFNVRYPPYKGNRAKGLDFMLKFGGVTQNGVQKIMVFLWILLALFLIFFKRENVVAVGSVVGNVVKGVLEGGIAKDL